MPHYLVRGAWKANASDAVWIGFARSEAKIRAAASKAALLVSSVEPLDDGEPVREDAGQPSALSRIATKLDGAGRVDDAAATMIQVYRMREDAGTRDAICLRIPRYYLGAGRHDDAWRVLNEIRAGLIRGNSLVVDRVPADVADWYRMAARVLKADKRRDHERIMLAAERIANTISEYWIVTDGTPRPGISGREDAVSQVAAFAGEVLPSQVDATAWAEGAVPPQRGLSMEIATQAAASIDAELLRAIRSP